VRTHDGRPIAGDPTGTWTSSESLTVEQALTAYTSSVAAQAFSDRSTPPGGTLRAGASADLVWLDRDPRTAPTGELTDIAVPAVWLAGRRQQR
jgi:predicted amidohydrolase YtcJ